MILVKKPVSLLILKGGCKDDIKQDYFCIRLLTERLGIQLNYLYDNYITRQKVKIRKIDILGLWPGLEENYRIS